MEQIEKINRLLENTKLIVNQYEQECKKKGADFNIFKILDAKEVLSCRMIRALINPQESHGYGSLFLKLFLKIVLKQESFSDEEINNATVSIEEAVEDLAEESVKKMMRGARRIDLYICVGERAFPIEVKLHARDQDGQCYDYYWYVVNKKDPQTIIYYLTLDRHMPSEESRKGLREGKELRLISFAKEIVEWLEKCLEQVQQCTVMKIIIEQFMDNINRLTGNEGGNLAMEMITDFETFKAADIIAKSVQKIKTEKMKKLFEKIERSLKDRKYVPFYADYIEKVDKYYYQSTSTHPSLNYYLDEENSLVLRIEVDWNLFLGICQWDKENKRSLPHKPENEESVVMKTKGYLRQEDDIYYGWEYLPFTQGEKINFKEFSGLYAKLFDGDESIIKEICDQVETVLKMWKDVGQG